MDQVRGCLVPIATSDPHVGDMMMPRCDYPDFPLEGGASRFVPCSTFSGVLYTDNASVLQSSEKTVQIGYDSGVQLTSDPLSLEQLLVELESLLSRESIISLVDPFIFNLLIYAAAPDLAIPVDDLAMHPRLAGATAEMLMEAASKSSILTVNRASRVIVPEVKSKRVTIILRDVDPSVTVTDVLELLAAHPKLSMSLQSNNTLTDVELSSEISSLSLIGGNWFLTLKDEGLTLDVAWWLRNQELKGFPVHARIKSETTLRLDFQSAIAPAYGRDWYQTNRSGRFFRDARRENRESRDGGGWRGARRPQCYQGTRRYEMRKAATTTCFIHDDDKRRLVGHKGPTECSSRDRAPPIDQYTAAASSSSTPCNQQQQVFTSNNRGDDTTCSRRSWPTRQSARYERGETINIHTNSQWRGRRKDHLSNTRRNLSKAAPGNDNRLDEKRNGLTNGNGSDSNKKPCIKKSVVVSQSDFPSLTESVEMKLSKSSGRVKDLHATCDGKHSVIPDVPSQSVGNVPLNQSPTKSSPANVQTLTNPCPEAPRRESSGATESILLETGCRSATSLRCCSEDSSLLSGYQAQGEEVNGGAAERIPSTESPGASSGASLAVNLASKQSVSVEGPRESPTSPDRLFLADSTRLREQNDDSYWSRDVAANIMATVPTTLL